MGKFKINFGEETPITKEEAMTLTKKWLLVAAKRNQDTNFLYCSKPEENMIQIDTPMSIYFFGNSIDSTIGFQFELFSARKYEPSIVDIEILHDEIGEVALEEGYNREVSHDAPAFYRTLIAGEIKDFKDDTKASDIITHLEEIMNRIYDKALVRAIDRNIRELENWKNTLTQNSEKEAK